MLQKLAQSFKIVQVRVEQKNVNRCVTYDQSYKFRHEEFRAIGHSDIRTFFRHFK